MDDSTSRSPGETAPRKASNPKQTAALDATVIGSDGANPPPGRTASAAARTTSSGKANASTTPTAGASKPTSSATGAAGATGEAAKAPAGQKRLSQLGDFKLIKKLGQGGMGEVFLAHQISLDRDVALKILNRQIAARPNFVERFYREARTMAKLDHPNIVRGFAVGEDQGFHFVAMELIDGKSMQDWLNKLGKLSLGDALHIGIRVADALQHAHDLSLIHRDIKPDNMLVTSKGVLKVSDLGLAKSVDEDNSMTQSGTGLGTPYYMPPEQARNAKHVDQRCDIYAFGSTLYHFLTGQYPFKADSTLELILLKEKGQYPPARKLNSEIPEKLSLMIDKMIMKDPNHRYQSCREVQAALESLGLANPALSFIEGAEANASAVLRSPPAGATTRPVRPAGASSSASGTLGSSKGGAVASPTGGKAVAGTDQTWFVKHTNDQGKIVIAKWTTQQILTLIKNEQLDLKAKVSKTASGEYVPLAHFPEFDSTVKARLVKEQSAKKSEQFNKLYENIDREQRWHGIKRWVRGLFESTAGLIWFLIYMAVLIGGIGGALYALFVYGLPMLKQYLKL